MGPTTNQNGKQRDGADNPPTARTDRTSVPANIEATLTSYSKAGDVYFFASDHEADYPETAKKINVKGGTFVGIAGGMEHNFAYWVASQPDTIVLYDVNSWAIKLAKAKCELLLACNSFEEFSKRSDNIFKGREQFAFSSITADDLSELVLAGIKTARTAVFLSPRCDRENGWDTPEQFAALKKIVASKAIEFNHADMLNADFANQRDISLVFVSDIFGIVANFERKAQLLETLRSCLGRGDLRRDAQVVDSDHAGKVALIADYIG